MKIKATQNPLDITKAAEDQRAEVSKKTPLFQKTTDTVEVGGSKQSGDPHKQESQTVEPTKQPGQITGAILTRQLAQARLTEAGVKSRGSQEQNEITGRKDLTPSQQAAADSIIKLQIEKNNFQDNATTSATSDIPVPDGAYTGDARSDREREAQELKDFMAAKGFDDFSGSGDVDPSNSGHTPPVSSEEVNQAFEGGPTGPGDAMNSVNKKFEQISALKNVNNLGNIGSELQNAAKTADGARRPYGKDMVAHAPSLGIDPTPAEIEEAKKKYRAEHPDNPPATPAEKESTGGAGQFIKDVVLNFMLGQGPRGVVLPPTPPDAETGKSMLDGFKAIFGGGDRTPESETKKGGTVHSTDQEHYQDPEVEKKRKEMESMLRNLGLNELVDMPRRPRTQDDVDPNPEDTQGDPTKAEPNVITMLGKDGLVGQPNQQRQTGGPNIGSSNPLAGGNIDYGPDSTESGWKGPTHTEEPADVNLSLGSKLSRADEEEEQNSTERKKTATKKR